MRQSFWDSFNTKVGNKYLDLVEKLPKIDKGFISRLQTIRECQRIDSKRVFESGRPPENVDIDFLGIQLFEAFDLSNFKALNIGLAKLFKGGNNSFNGLDNINQNKGNLTGVGWVFIGHIAKKNNNRFVRPSVVLPSLPEFVNNIELRLYRILPSQYVMSIDVCFDKIVTEQFNNIINKSYLPKVKLHSLLPWNISKKGYTQYPSNFTAEEELTKWINSLRHSIEKCICPFFNGSFTNSYCKNKVKLPCINWLILKDDDKIEMSLSDWLTRHRWLRSIGFSETTSDISYKSNESIFATPCTNKNTISPYVVIALKNDILKTNDSTAGFGNEINAIWHNLGYTKAELTKALSIIFLLQLMRKELKNTRLKIVEILKHKSFRKFNKTLDVNSSLQSISTKIHEINREFNKNNAFIKHELNELASAKNRFDDNNNLKEDTFSFIEIHFKTLLDTLNVLEKSFSDYINNTNIRIMFKLQSRILGITIVATIATIIGIIVNWDEFYDLLKSIFV